MKWLYVTSLVAGVVLACILSTAEGNKRVPKPIVQVYYESLCGDSRRFIQRQLYPLKTSPLGEYFYVDLIPYGKATTRRSGDTYTFDCQHGPDECRGNKLHACAINNFFPNETKSLEFVYCSMSAQYPPNALNECVSRVGASISEKNAIDECVSSNQGSELLARNGERTNTLSPKLYFVPWITINGIFNQEKFQQSLSDLKTVICRELHNDGKTPEACQGLDLSLEVRSKIGLDMSGGNMNGARNFREIGFVALGSYLSHRYLL